MEDSKRIYKFYGKSGEDFFLWTTRTEAALESKKVWSVVATDVIGDGSVAVDESTAESIATARAMIIQGLGDKPLRMCMAQKGNPCMMWRRLKERYALSNVTTKVQLQTKLARMTYSNQPMGDYIDGFEEVFNRLEGMQSAVAEDLQVAMLLASFGDKNKSSYGHAIYSLQSGADSPSWETVTAKLLQESEEKQWASSSSRGSLKQTTESVVALTAASGRKLTQFRKQRTERRRCFSCNKVGHLARNCSSSQKSTRRDSDEKQTSFANHAVMMMAGTFHGTGVEFVIDSGASDHMVRRAEWLTKRKNIRPRAILLGNGKTVMARESGTLALSATIRYKEEVYTYELFLDDVLLVPELHTNLLSCPALCREDFQVLFGRGKCNAMKDGILRLQGTLRSGVFIAECHPVSRDEWSMTPSEPNGGNCSSAYSAIPRHADEETEKLWHDRLAHANIPSIRELESKGAVTGLDLSHSSQKMEVHCEDCAQGKQHKLHMSSKHIRSTHRGEVIHSDVCGPMSVSSLGGSKYFVTFIDEYSGYVTVVSMSKKSDVQSHFKKYQAWLERRYDCVIKVLHCDGGGEYQALDGYLALLGIERLRLPPYSPQQNGMAERTNRTLVECAKSMLFHAKLPTQFWAEAISFAADVRNRFLCPRVRQKTSFELMTGKIPRVDHLRVFGSTAWTFVPKERRKKLDAKSECGVMVGCFENSLYKVWIPERRTALLTRHVRILENNFLDSGRVQTDEAEEELYPGEEHSDKTVSVPNKNVNPIAPVISATEIQSTPSPTESPLTAAEQDMLTYIPEKLSVTRGRDDSDEIHMDSPDVHAERGSNPGAIGTTDSARYSTRNRVRTDFYTAGSAQLATADQDPTSISEAMSRPDASFWKGALESEMKSLKDHCTWSIEELPPGTKPLRSRVVFKKKLLSDGSVGRYKARVVVKGFMQGTVESTYAPVVDFSTVRTALVIAVKRNYIIHQMDVRTAFLHGEIDEKVFIVPPPDCGINLKPGQALRLRKGLYGLKQAPRLWHDKWSTVVNSLGFRALVMDSCVYRRGGVWILLYVDDVMLMGRELSEICKAKEDLSTLLEMKDLGELSSFLGVSFIRDKGGAWLSQSHYCSQVLQRFGMDSCKPVSTPACLQVDMLEPSTPADTTRYQEIVGSLLFLATRTRPDISVAVNLLSRHNASPTNANMVSAKRVLRYLRGTSEFALRLKTSGEDLKAFSDADWAGDRKDRKSTSGVLLQIGGSSVVWKSGKQSCTALSSTAAEHIALSETCKEVIWMRALLQEFTEDEGIPSSPPTIVYEDNQITIGWGNDGVRNTKHVAVRRNFVREQVQNSVVQLVYLPTEHMVADVLTKPLLRVKFETHRDNLEVREQSKEK